MLTLLEFKQSRNSINVHRILDRFSLCEYNCLYGFFTMPNIKRSRVSFVQKFEKKNTENESVACFLVFFKSSNKIYIFLRIISTDILLKSSN